ncbi:MAG: GNAT family N-acetyltransferase [Planctomycetota bacterium]|jgi:ribosomal protein S18 acetylase RimI-like enzyme|nr:GNAT family N-acetyltransferase [Planctomycetota bacterium]MDP6501957.1 GNAT family N-acetyltransferase [Planctomycetota bacterium]
MFLPIASSLSSIDVIFDDMELAWKEAGRPPDGFREQLENKKKELGGEESSGILMFDGERPVGAAWVDLPHGNYGSLLMHTTQPEYRAGLAQECVDRGMMSDVILELIQFRPGDEFRDAFKAAGLEEKFRQKMAYPLDPPPPAPELPSDITMEPLAVEHAEMAGRISHAAHDISKDLEGYHDFVSPESRAGLERRIFSGMFGPVITQASLFVRYRGEPAGVCLVVGIPGWGYDQVAWILDMAIRPGLQGHGIGRTMMQQSLCGMASAGIPIAGLAVTVDNGHAVRMYEKVGFHVVEQFYEYVIRKA